MKLKKLSSLALILGLVFVSSSTGISNANGVDNVTKDSIYSNFREC